jgi:hypothetical protein
MIRQVIWNEGDMGVHFHSSSRLVTAVGRSVCFFGSEKVLIAIKKSNQ